MKNIAIINGMEMSKYSFLKLKQQKTSLDYVNLFLKKIPDIKDIYFLGKNNAHDIPWQNSIIMDSWSLTKMIQKWVELAKGYDHLFYFYADEPLLDSELTVKMYENHIKYFADYSYGDGFPKGITLEIIKTGILTQLEKLSDKCKQKIERTSLFSVIAKDINAFDIETEISPVDLRLLRLDLNCSKKQNYFLTKKMLASGIDNYSDVMDFCIKKPEELRSLPYYYSIQLTAKCPQSCSYCPYPILHPQHKEDETVIPMEKFESLLKNIADFSDHGVINFSPLGEPALHPHIYSMINRVLDCPGFSCVIETSGIGWDFEELLNLKKRDLNSLNFIISLDAKNLMLYKKLRGSGFEQAHGAVKFFLENFKEQLYIQAVRMNDNEEDLENFYKIWKEQTEQVIIQKYNAFCGLLPERKVTDISPLKRFPCWHLKRDMTILLDGSVPLCNQDLKKENLLGNAFLKPLDEIWARAQDFYLKHIDEDYPSLCKDCDEYYTFNF